MGDMKIYVPDELEDEFKKRSMETYGYGRGSISKAAKDAIQKWTAERETINTRFSPPKDPVKTIRGMLKDVKKTSVELQHEARRIRAHRGKGAH